MVSPFWGSLLIGPLLNSVVRSPSLVREIFVFSAARWQLPSGAGVRRTMIMLAVGRTLMGAVFPLTGFTEMPKAGSVSQQPVQQPGQQAVNNRFSR